MKKFAPIFLCLFLVGSLVACSDEAGQREEAQDRSSQLVDQQNDLVAQLCSMGVPSTSWTETQLEQYEQTLNSLERVENDLQALNGSHGITIYGDNRDRIPALRANLQRIRRLKQLNSELREAEEQRELLARAQQATERAARLLEANRLRAELTVIQQRTNAIQAEKDAFAAQYPEANDMGFSQYS